MSENKERLEKIARDLRKPRAAAGTQARDVSHDGTMAVDAVLALLDVMLDEMGGEAPAPDGGRYVPKDGEHYHFLSDAGIPIMAIWGEELTLDELRLALGNVYRTRAEAERARDAQLLRVEIEDFAAKAWAASLETNIGTGVELAYSLSTGEWSDAAVMALPSVGSIVFPDDGSVARAIRHFGDRLNLLLPDVGAGKGGE